MRKKERWSRKRERGRERSRMRRGDWYKWMVKSCREQNARKRVQVCSPPTSAHAHLWNLWAQVFSRDQTWQLTALLWTNKPTFAGKVWSKLLHQPTAPSSLALKPSQVLLPLCPWTATFLFHLWDPTQCPPLWHFPPQLSLVHWVGHVVFNYLFIYAH